MSLIEIFFFSSYITIELDKGYCELKMFRIIFLFGIGSILFLLTGCNDTPNSVGKGSQPPEDYGIVHIDTFYATANSSVPTRIFTTSTDRFMLGNYKSYQAWACLKFYSWPDSMLGVQITGATIQLKGIYHFGDSLAPLSFTVHRALSSLFLSDSLTFDSLSMNSVNSVNGVYYNTSPLSIQTSLTGSGDTASLAISISDTTMLRQWFSTNTDTMNLNDGLVFKPTNSNCIKGFSSFTASDTASEPTLYITYRDTNGISQIYSHKIGASQYVSTVNKTSLITDNNLMYVQNGISYRGLASFDSLSIPWPALIHRAVLQVSLNSSQSSSQQTPFLFDSLYALSVGADEKSDGGSYGLSQRTIDSSGFSTYSFEIRSVATRMLSNASAKKIALSGYFENGSFDLHALYGAGSSKKLKPKLIITYSVQR